MKETKFKQTEVGMIPSDWNVVSLNSVVDFFNGDRGVNYPKDSDFCDVGVPFINAGHLKKCQIDFSCMDYITYAHYKRLGGAKIKKNDILFCLRGSLGKYAYVNFDEAAPASSLCVLRSKKIDSKYLFQLLGFEYIKTQIVDANSGSSQPNLSAKDVGNFNVILPPTIEEQQRIANALSDVDTLINNLEKLIAKKKNIKQGAMQQLLTGRKRLPGFAPAKPTYKQTELGKIPTDWEVKTLNELCECNRSSTLSLPKEFVYVDLESVYQGKLLKRQIIKACDAPSRAQRFFEKGDILYQTVRPYQRNNLKVDFDAKNYIASTGYAVLHCKESLLNSDYLYQYIHTDRFVDVVMDNCSGTSYPAINPKTLMTFNIIIPSSFKEQTAIANILSDMDTEIATLETKLAKYRKLKTGMMQQLLTGKIRLV